MKLIKLFKNPYIIFNYLSNKGFFNFLSDETFIKYRFRASFGIKIDLNNPKTFNEKIQWLKLFYRKPEFSIMADKYKVREYVESVIGKEYLIPLFGVWDDPEDIDFNILPNQFVLKCNHNSGLGMYICKDKANINEKEVKKWLKKGLSQNYFLTGREWCYKNINKKIIAEKYMIDDSGEEIKDYKIMCFNGEPRIILVCSDRFSESGLKENFYDLDWNLLEVKRPKHPNASNHLMKPKNLDLMINIARKLAKNIPFVRIDLYEINGKVYFGEITFYPASGFEKFYPEEWDRKLGDWITLPDKKITD